MAYQTPATHRTEPATAGMMLPDNPDPAAMPALPTNARDIFARAHLNDDLHALEALLLARTESHSSSIAAAGAHTVQAGGKRLRAALTLLAARLRGSYRFEQSVHAAAAVELIHAASLVHDDLVDHTLKRRGHVTVHALWDNDVALMVGDYFFALAAAEMALCPDTRIITYYAQAVQTIVEGELHPVTTTTPFEVAMQQYLFKTGAKTAALFEAGCKAGMATGGGSEADIAALGRYGYSLGMAFQIVDDILDFTADEQTMGKPAGNDLREGTITLPLIYAIAESDNPILHQAIGAGSASPTGPDDAHSPNSPNTLVAQAIAEVKRAGGIQRAAAEAARSIAEAEAALEGIAPFADTTAHHAMRELASFVLERQA